VPRRQRALEETIHILRGMWGEVPFTYHGEQFRVENARCSPGPVQRPRIPLVIAGGGERVTLRQVAQFADASNFGAHPWTGGAVSLEDVTRKYDALCHHCEAFGRPYESVLRSHHTLPLVLAETAAAAQAKLAAAPTSPRQESSRIVDTPDAAIRVYRGLAAAGVRYFVATVRPADAETICLLAERVVPAITAS
jgi:alkanesulfonate monooxygenase SsuD/methylene tetrahydromethanopterin reductase-like flavin-dependent oxidoreductase (luciferase family)